MSPLLLSDRVSSSLTVLAQEYDDIYFADLFMCCFCDDDGRPLSAAYSKIGTKDLDVAEEGDLGPAMIKPKGAVVNPA